MTRDEFNKRFAAKGEQVSDAYSPEDLEAINDAVFAEVQHLNARDASTQKTVMAALKKRFET